MTRPFAVVAVLAMVALLVLSGCTGTAGRGISDDVRPVDDAGGHPAYSAGGIPVNPGVPGNFTAVLTNKSDAPVTVVRARLIPVPGFATGRIAKFARYPGKDSMAAGRGWPPGGFHVLPLIGRRLPQGLVMIAYSMQGARAGQFYATAGVKLTLREHGELTTASAYGGGAVCIIPRGGHRTGSCDGRFSKADAAIAAFTHNQPG